MRVAGVVCGMRLMPPTLLLPFGFAAALLAVPLSSRGQNREDWKALVSLRPNAAAQAEISKRPSEPPLGPWHVQKIERADGPLGLDLHVLAVTTPPKVLGKDMTADEFFQFVRTHLSAFFAPAAGSGSPASFEDLWRWESKTPIGTVWELSWKNGDEAAQAAAMVTEVFPAQWTMTLLYSGKLGFGKSPLAGSRSFSISPRAGGGYAFATRGAFRTSGTTEGAAERCFAMDSALWQGLLGKLKALIDGQGGKAEVEPPLLLKEDWNAVRTALHAPTEKWQDLEGIWESTDKDRRFRIEIGEGFSQCELVERKGGQELRKPVAVRGAGALSWALERENTDRDVLTFLGFRDSIQEEILKAAPKASVLTLTKKGDRLKASWQGILVQRDGKGNISAIRQPGSVRAKDFEFIPAPEPTPPPPATPAPQPGA